MQTKSSLRISIRFFIMSLAAIFILCSIPDKAHADETFNSFVSFLRELDEFMPPGTSLDNVLPVSIDEIESSGDYISCLAETGGDLYKTAECMKNDIDQHSGNAAEAAIPEEIEIIVDVYLKFYSGDYIGLAGVLASEEVVCAVLEWISGTNVCALLEALAEVAEAMYDAAKAVYEFLKDVGGAFVNAYCDTIGLGCDDDSVPLYISVYTTDFHPHVSWGVTHGREIEGIDTFNQVLTNLKAIARAKADSANGTAMESLYEVMYSTNNVNKAAQIYVANVNTQWTNLIANRYVHERRARLDSFSLNELLFLSLNSSITPWRPQFIIPDIIVDRLKNNYNYGHIDTWKVTDVGADNNKFKSTVLTNREISDSFYKSNEATFARLAEEHVTETSSCYIFSGDIICNTTDDYQLCRDLMAPFASIDSIKTCGMDTHVLGEEAKEKMAARFRTAGSKYYDFDSKKTITQVQGTANFIKVKSVNTMQVPSTEPLDFIIYRPIHQSHFNQFYQELFGDTPQKLLKAVLQEDPAYKQLRETYVPAAVEKLNNDFLFALGSYRVSATDPLLVNAPAPQMYNAVKETNPTYDGFGNFVFSLDPQQLMNPVDGLSSPVMNVDADKPQHAPLDGVALQEELTIPDVGAIQKSDAVSKIADRTGFTEENTLVKKSVARLSSQKLTAAGAVKTVTADPGAMNKVGAGQSSTQVKSLQTPGGIDLPGSKPTLSTTNTKQSFSQTPAAKAMAPVLADLQLDKKISVAGMDGRWGSTMSMNEKNGKCEVLLIYTLMNQGDAAAGSFKTRWLTPAGSRPVFRAPLKAGAKRTETETLTLKPGVNRFTFMVDALNQIRENDENNNTYNLTIRLNGNCGTERDQPGTTPTTIKKTAPRPTMQPRGTATKEQSQPVKNTPPITRPNNNSTPLLKKIPITK